MGEAPVKTAWKSAPPSTARSTAGAAAADAVADAVDFVGASDLSDFAEPLFSASADFEPQAAERRHAERRSGSEAFIEDLLTATMRSPREGGLSAAA
jgi:hypothetical protein